MHIPLKKCNNYRSLIRCLISRSVYLLFINIFGCFAFLNYLCVVLRARSLNFWGRRGRSLESILITCCKEHTPVCDWKQVIKSGQGYETQVTSTFPWILESQIIINILLTLFYKKVKMATKLAMYTGNFSYLCLYDPKNLRNAL